MKMVSIVWRTVVTIVAIVIGAVAADQIGWSGADLALYEPLMDWVETGLNLLFLILAVVVAFGSILLVEYCIPRAIYIQVPIMAIALIIDTWNGYWSDFDYTRLQALKRPSEPANAYALQHMTKRGLYLTCNDTRIHLTEDGDKYCAEKLVVAPGEQVPGSEHYCGNYLLNVFFRQSPLVCVDTSPK